jgi:hypothetical protein
MTNAAGTDVVAPQNLAAISVFTNDALSYTDTQSLESYTLSL